MSLGLFLSQLTLGGSQQGGIPALTVDPLTVEEGATGAVLTFSTVMTGTIVWSLVPGHDAGGHASIDSGTGVVSLTAGWTEAQLADIWVWATNGTQHRTDSTANLGVTMVPASELASALYLNGEPLLLNTDYLILN